MARQDVRSLREEAASASADGKHRRALECYLELERLELAEPNWPKRAAEIYRRLGKTREAIAAYERAIERYVRGGFLVQAIAVCKVILQMEPAHAAAQDRLAEISEQQAAGQSQFGALADRHRSLHGVPAVEALRAAEQAERRRRASSMPPPAPEPMIIERAGREEAVGPPAVVHINIASGVDLGAGPPADDLDSFGAPRRRPRRMSSGPVYLSPGAPLASVPLSEILPGPAPTPRDEHSQAGVIVIPIDEDPIYELSPTELVDADDDDHHVTGEVVPSDGLGAASAADIPLDIGPAIEAEPPVLRAPRAPSQADLDELGSDPMIDAAVELDDGDDGSGPTEELSVEDLEEDEARPRGPYTASARRALATTPLFASLPAAALERLITRIELVEVEGGQVLFRQGDPGLNLFVVVEGAVRVYTEGPPETELMRLGPGSFFGEIALVTDHPRSASVVTLEPTQLISIDRDAVRTLMHEHPEVLPILLRFVRERLVDSLVRTHPMFVPFGDPDRRYLIGRFRFVEIEAGTAFVEQGVKTTGLYVLMAGSAEILRDGQVIGRLDAGDLVGETSVLSGGGCPVTAKAGPRCLALLLPRADFHEIIMTHPQVLSYVGDLADERTRAWAAGSPATMRVKMV